MFAQMPKPSVTNVGIAKFVDPADSNVILRIIMMLTQAIPNSGVQIRSYDGLYAKRPATTPCIRVFWIILTVGWRDCGAGVPAAVNRSPSDSNWFFVTLKNGCPTI